MGQGVAHAPIVAFYFIFFDYKTSSFMLIPVESMVFPLYYWALYCCKLGLLSFYFLYFLSGSRVYWIRWTCTHDGVTYGGVRAKGGLVDGVVLILFLFYFIFLPLYDACDENIYF